MMVYLDNSSTTRPYDEVIKEVASCMGDTFGNPSSLHGLGIDAEKKIKKARETAARAFGADKDEIFFTGSGTEGDNLAIIGTANAKKRAGKRIITTALEHPAVLEPCAFLEKQGFEVIRIGCDKKGHLDMDAMKDAINDDTILISVMHVNNEIGSVNDIRAIADMKKNAVLHTDAVQSFGKIGINAGSMGADIISVSGHKIHGPKGVGCVYIRKGLNITPYIMGGGQEKGMRSGTENVPAISAFGKAIEISDGDMKSRVEKMSAARDHLLQGIKDGIPDILINSPDDACPSVLNISFLGTRGEVILHMLEDAKIYVSTGSACSSNKKGQSHVLTELGLSGKEIEGAIRFSFSEFNTIEEMDYVLENLTAIVKRFRRLGTFR